MIRIRDNSLGIAMDYELEGPCSIRGRGTESKPGLRPTEPHIKWVPGLFSSGVNLAGHEADFHLVALHFHCRIRLHGVVLNILSTVKTLSFFFLLRTYGDCNIIHAQSVSQGCCECDVCCGHVTVQWQICVPLS
jgi:hypothetical protein